MGTDGPAHNGKVAAGTGSLAGLWPILPGRDHLPCRAPAAPDQRGIPPHLREAAMTQAPAAPRHVFRDRQDAGRVLAGLLHTYRDRPDVVVLALPRGGVPVAYEVARALHAPLDIFTVRKLGVPGHEELAMGAIASGGLMVLVDDVVRGLALSPEVIQQAADAGGARAAAPRARRTARAVPALDVTGRTVIVVDDGLATGASMQAAVQALRRLRPSRDRRGRAGRSRVDRAGPGGTRRHGGLCDHPLPLPGRRRGVLGLRPDQRQRGARPARGPPPSTARRGARPPDDLVPDPRRRPPGRRTAPPADDLLFDLVGDAHLVLIGEASHGTHEFYEARARMTRAADPGEGLPRGRGRGRLAGRLPGEPYVRGRSKDETAEEALRGFERFPAWMWRNEVVLDFVAWLREHNDQQDTRDQAGFYGLDLYSLNRSGRGGHRLPRRRRPDGGRAGPRALRLPRPPHLRRRARSSAAAARSARARPASARSSTSWSSCSRHEQEYSVRDGLLAEDEYFCAEQNARVVKAAAHYYRSMFGGRASSWNLRDLHMADTLDALLEHLVPRARRAGQDRGLGAQLAPRRRPRHRDRRPRRAQRRPAGARAPRRRLPVSIGFTTHAGTVTAADHWGGTAHRKRVRPGHRAASRSCSTRPASRRSCSGSTTGHRRPT